MSTFVKNLTFYAKNLGERVTLLLVFDKPFRDSELQGSPKSYPIVWRVVDFAASGEYSMQATYTSQYAALKPQVVNGIVVGASTFVDISYNQRTTLTDADGIFSLSLPETGTSNYIEIVNATKAIQDVALGFKDTRSPLPMPVLYIDNVAVNSSVKPQFTPILRAYVTTSTEFKETYILKHPIVGKAVWEQDLAALDETTRWILSKDYMAGQYKIEEAPWKHYDDVERT
ncbi:hypothetical protein SERLA73DRAFT_189370 [Serpula lacrymans var. lacrymans S7.3]|uniref:Uncharacterized protein n=2 Tax=Serpula lacrymans var. lacrymans TaxID=341189 RepID=F8QDG9_SERL3|nr:uncharacterized protein SERLADRAFT_480153 [Serpula lacrymans var. lacrymans S7.9]EGN93640.1 hypothetical protein SERLA73DRAFT_189370 [Serpula lacrymans var. lacrymans S7.3]EGO19017.1 hypothetical protein SERLADRAFT_480153 [Serpula lacrymans var. lacrymans S7.9]